MERNRVGSPREFSRDFLSFSLSSPPLLISFSLSADSQYNVLWRRSAVEV